VNIALRLRWCAATTAGLALSGFGMHFPGGTPIGNGLDEWQPSAMVFGAFLGALSGLITGALQWAALRPAGPSFVRLSAVMMLGIGATHALADGAPTSVGLGAVAVAGAIAITVGLAIAIGERGWLAFAASLGGWVGGLLIAYELTSALGLPASQDPGGWATHHAVIGVIVGVIWSALVAATASLWLAPRADRPVAAIS
jgi:hypothetical protein